MLTIDNNWFHSVTAAGGAETEWNVLKEREESTIIHLVEKERKEYKNIQLPEARKSQESDESNAIKERKEYPIIPPRRIFNYLPLLKKESTFINTKKSAKDKQQGKKELSEKYSGNNMDLYPLVDRKVSSIINPS